MSGRFISHPQPSIHKQVFEEGWERARAGETDARIAAITAELEGSSSVAIRQLGRLWLENTETNRKNGDLRLGGPRRDVRDLFHGRENKRAATVIGAGPSLAGRVGDISEQTITVAVDRSYHYLVSEGVTPDFVVTVDPREEVKDFLKTRRSGSTALVAPVWTHPKVLRAWPGRVYLCGPPPSPAGESAILDMVRELSGAQGFIQHGGNCGSAAVALSHSVLCCLRIFAVGLDFSWGERMYCDGAREDLRPVGEREIRTPEGERVWTSDVYEGYARNLETEILEASRQVDRECGLRPLEVFNCSGGLLRKGVTRADLTEAYKQQGLQPGYRRRRS